MASKNQAIIFGLLLFIGVLAFVFSQINDGSLTGSAVAGKGLENKEDKADLKEKATGNHEKASREASAKIEIEEEIEIEESEDAEESAAEKISKRADEKETEEPEIEEPEIEEPEIGLSVKNAEPEVDEPEVAEEPEVDTEPEKVQEMKKELAPEASFAEPAIQGMAVAEKNELMKAVKDKVEKKVNNKKAEITVQEPVPVQAENAVVLGHEVMDASVDAVGIIIFAEQESEQIIKNIGDDAGAENIANQLRAASDNLDKAAQNAVEETRRAYENAKKSIDIEKTAQVVEDSDEDLIVVRIRISPKADLKDLEIYETIPKEVASDASELVFYDDNVRVVEEDPVIVWAMGMITSDTTLEYGVRTKNVELIEKAETVPLSKAPSITSASVMGHATKVPESEDSMSMALLVMVLFVIVLVVIVFTFRRKSQPKEEFN